MSKAELIKELTESTTFCSAEAESMIDFLIKKGSSLNHVQDIVLKAKTDVAYLLAVIYRLRLGLVVGPLYKVVD